ncbi:uncharacterized protein BDV14DRAFT_14212 [Aspergillus stella-maris]|uniref:uncharacterized protein n=1 Tax=Aspergillus stella-maris TaxID=1810926 RepID=UPI003CCD3F2D
MARRYEIEELIWLRESPLVTRPANLPPVEEWMGPLPDRTAQRNPSNNHNDPSARRPSIFETRHISRNSNSEDIVLGPPKTAFASASRIAGKGSIDATERLPPSDDTKNDRFNLRDKFFKDRDGGDRDFAGREGKMGTFNNRRGDKEDWNNGRPRRPLGPEDQERKPKRNGEFDRWEARDPRDPNGAKDKDGRFAPRREVPPGRARHEGSWFRDDNVQDATEIEEEKASMRSRDWRRDRHGADRDWTRGAKLEQEPEWLDATDREEPRRVHTQEDFERWKEKMKAGSQAPIEERRESPIEQVPEPVQKSETRPTDGEIFSPGGVTLPDTTMERFFGFLGEPKPAQDVGSSLSSAEPAMKSQAPLPKAGKSSRFAGLFSPPLGSPAKEPESPISAKSPAPFNPSSTDADQEGFQRILQMLGGGRSRNATPHNDSVQSFGQPNRPSSLVHSEQTRSSASPPREQQRPEQMPMQDNAPRAMDSPLKENSFFGQEPHGRDSQHLLRLMQQVRVGPGSGPNQGPQNQPQSAGPAPGLMNLPDGMPHPPGIGPGMKGPGFLDDPAIAAMQRPDIEHLRRRPANGPPPGYFDDVPFQGGQPPITPGGSRVPQGQGPPMGIPRPPGFEHMPPPGWAGHQLPPQQGGPPGPLGPPPGIPTPTRGVNPPGVNPNFMSNAMPMHGNIPPNERQPFPRGPIPPGMMPPPGYMNVPPPGGFPPMPHNGDNMMGPFDGNPGLQGPPPSNRHLLDMFAQVGGDVRGGMVGPRQFR